MSDPTPGNSCLGTVSTGRKLVVTVDVYSFLLVGFPKRRASVFEYKYFGIPYSRIFV